jgi:hypothetical protein
MNQDTMWVKGMSIYLNKRKEWHKADFITKADFNLDTRGSIPYGATPK